MVECSGAGWKSFGLWVVVGVKDSNGTDSEPLMAISVDHDIGCVTKD